MVIVKVLYLLGFSISSPIASQINDSTMIDFLLRTPSEIRQSASQTSTDSFTIDPQSDLSLTAGRLLEARQPILTGRNQQTLTRCVPVLFSEAGEFLVRHGRSRILSEPRSGPQDETLGSVSIDIVALCNLNRGQDLFDTEQKPRHRLIS